MLVEATPHNNNVTPTQHRSISSHAHACEAASIVPAHAPCQSFQPFVGDTTESPTSCTLFPFLGAFSQYHQPTFMPISTLQQARVTGARHKPILYSSTMTPSPHTPDTGPRPHVFRLWPALSLTVRMCFPRGIPPTRPTRAPTPYFGLA